MNACHLAQQAWLNTTPFYIMGQILGTATSVFHYPGRRHVAMSTFRLSLGWLLGLYFMKQPTTRPSPLMTGTTLCTMTPKRRQILMNNRRIWYFCIRIRCLDGVLEIVIPDLIHLAVRHHPKGVAAGASLALLHIHR